MCCRVEGGGLARGREEECEGYVEVDCCPLSLNMCTHQLPWSSSWSAYCHPHMHTHKHAHTHTHTHTAVL